MQSKPIAGDFDAGTAKRVTFFNENFSADAAIS
jgi:hypothetical protein